MAFQRKLRYSFMLFFMLVAVVQANHGTLDNNDFNTLPDSNTASFRTNSRIFLQHETAQREGRYFGPFVYSGGLHGTSSTLSAPSFATEAFLPERISQTSTVIAYAAAVNDVCWTIISSDNNGITGWTRVGTTAYYYQCEGDTTPNQPDLPPNSAWLMQSTITASAIAVVADLRSTHAIGFDRVERYVSFSAAIDEYNDSGDPNVFLALSSRMHVTEDTTLTSNITLHIYRGGMLDVRSGVTLRIPCSNDLAGNYQIFTGSGVVELSGCIQNVMWRGAIADSVGTDGTNSGPAIQAALTDVVDRQTGIYFPAARNTCYRSNQALTLTLAGSGSGVQLVGDGGLNAVICGNGGSAADVLTINGTTGTAPVLVENLTLYGTTNSRDGLVLIDLDKPTFKHVFVTGARVTCVRIQGSIIGTWLGGGCTNGVGSPGGAAAVPVYGLVMEPSAATSGSDGWFFGGTTWNGASEASVAITGATNASPIQITTASDAFGNNDVVYITGVAGNTAANGAWRLGKVGASIYNLAAPASTGNGSYGGGGAARRGTQIFMRASSFANAFVAGGVCPGPIGIFVDDAAGTNLFSGIDTGDCSEPFTDVMFNNGGSGTSSSVSGATNSGNTRVGGRLFVGGSDTSELFPRDGLGRLGLRRAQANIIRLFGMGSTIGNVDIYIQGAGTTGAVRLRAGGDGTDLGTGGADALIIQGGSSNPYAIAGTGGFYLNKTTLANINIPAPVDDGVLKYCTDCARGSSPCGGGSNGSFAMYENGVWNCR